MANIRIPIDECGKINGVLCGQARRNVILTQNKLQAESKSGHRPSMLEVINKMCREYPVK